MNKSICDKCKLCTGPYISSEKNDGNCIYKREYSFTNNKYETFLTFCNIFPTVDTVIVKQSLKRYKNKSPVRDKNKNKRFNWELTES